MSDVISLEDRGVIAISGEDAEGFLQNLVTNDIQSLKTDEARFAALLTPQGKIIADFLVFRDSDDTRPCFFLDCPRAQIAELIRRFERYRLRAKIKIEDLSEPMCCLAYLRDDRPQDQHIALARDPRSPRLGWRALAQRGSVKADGARSDYEARRVALVVPDGSRDFPYGDAFPHEANMDRLHGLDFKKGCYVGQEVVARMQHRGLTRKRIVPYRSTNEAPPTGAPVSIGGVDIGITGSRIEHGGLAFIRLDRLDEAAARGETAQAAGIALEFPHQ